MATLITTQLFDERSDLPLEQQREGLAFARFLKTQLTGVPGSAFLPFAGSIPSSELKQIQEFIE